MSHPTLAALGAAVLLLAASSGAAQDSTPFADAPAPPAGPETISRDAQGRATIRAIKLDQPLRLDGRLDEDVYRTVPPFGGLLQVVPKNGAPATEKTDVWIMYDTRNIYVAARCWDSAPPDQWVANELRRDTAQLRQNDNFGIGFDTFYDRRSAVMFYTNPLGGLADFSVEDEGAPNSNWNTVWDVRTGRFNGGWTVEMAIPFKSLRYRSGAGRTWGVQLRRAVRRKNEWDYLTPLPASLGGPQGFDRVSAFATLVGLDLPPASKNMEVKPYAISRLTTDRLAEPPLSNHPGGDVGGDLKYGVTANLTADLTYNTDFAQVEVDEQQVNLTRFSLFYPEKRDFFLEGSGIFDFARGGVTGGGASTVPYLFYSRRIGLNDSRIVPIRGGGRLTGKAGRWALGLMNIETGREPVSASDPTNFTVLRATRDILRRSTIGAMFTNRSISTSGPGGNQAYGLDAALSFYENVGFGGYYARTRTAGQSGDDESYRGLFDYGADRYGAHLEYMKVGADFNPEIGFVSRRDFRRTYGSLRFSPRPVSIRSVRKFTWQGEFDNYLDGAGLLETRVETGTFNTEFENSDQLKAVVTRDAERLPADASILGVTWPAGGYEFTNTVLSYAFGQQRPVSGTLALQAGQFYGGTLTSLGFSSARLEVLKQFSFEPTISLNRVRSPFGNATTRLYRSRADYGFSPRMFASALVQYSSSDHSVSSFLRFRWEYIPGSEFFVVYTDERDTSALGPLAAGAPMAGAPVSGLKNRAFVVKINKLLRF